MGCHLNRNILRDFFWKQYWKMISTCLNLKLDTCRYPPTKDKCTKSWLSSPISTGIEQKILKTDRILHLKEKFTSLRLLLFYCFAWFFSVKPADLLFCALNSILCVLLLSPAFQGHWVWMKFSEHSHRHSPMKRARRSSLPL